MNKSRTRNSILIALSSGFRQGLTILFTFISRTVFIKVLGADYLGLNGLFSNVLSLLSLTELGIGAAILFYLYRPVADNNKELIKKLIGLYKTCYMVVGFAMIIVGVFLMPFLSYMVKFEQDIPINLYLVYFLFLCNVASSYLFFSYKQSIVIANQEQYKIETINILFVFISTIADIVILISFRNYILYLLIKIAITILKNLVISIMIDREYPFLKDKNAEKLSKEEVGVIFKDVGSVCLFKIGSTLFNATDNIIISIMFGTVIVGYYSNYFLIISQVALIVGIITKAFVAGIGNVITSENSSKQYEIFKQIDFIIYVIAIICTNCIFQLANSFIKIWLGNIGEEYILSQIVVLFLSLSFYFDTTTQVPNMFREASGNFKTGRSLQLIGGGVNVILSLVLGYVWGLEGVFAATIIGKGLITVIPFICMISKNVFGLKRMFLLRHYLLNLVIMVFSLAITWLCCADIHMGGIKYFFLELFVSIMIPIVLLWIFYGRSDEIRKLRDRVRQKIKKDNL